MPSHRVLICSCETILGSALNKLLSEETELEVLGIPNQDVQQIIETIKSFNPHTVILADQYCASSFSQMQKIILDLPSKNLISLSADSNWVHVFQEKKLWAPRSEDLMSIIHSLGKEA